MTWFKVDDSFYRSRKVRRLGADRMPAVGLWTLCGDWSADNLSDGFVPWEIVEDWDQNRRYAKRLIAVALWYEAERDGEAGIQFHDWSDWQPTRDQVVQRRKADAERRARWRDARRGNGVTPVDPATASHEVSREESRRDTSCESQAGSQQESRSGSALPDPTRPDPIRTTPPSSADADGGFDEFWRAYPRRVQKRDALKAWRQMRREKIPVERMITGARGYAEYIRAEARSPDKVKHPASWLRAGGYDDHLPAPEPVPDTRDPVDILRSLWQAADAASVARILRRPWVEPEQPPSDTTPYEKWITEARRNWISQHHEAAVAALHAARESA